MYKGYDSLVSVSLAMSDTNRESLADAFEIEFSKFTFAENVINHEWILDASCEALDADLLSWMQGNTVFLNIGRMSPEKDHAKLIRAFKQVSARNQRARLVLLGDGPLRDDVEQLVRSLELERVVLLAGQRRNPFPALKACNCFVLSSNHEGQPMVLLEAMTLGKPIVATNIDGNRGALLGRGGTLVENSAEGLASGMLAFIEGKINPSCFDAIVYRENAMIHFDQAILDGGRMAAVGSDRLRGGHLLDG